MALIKCPECGHEVSEHATSCPQCGFPLSPAADAAQTPPSAESEPAAEQNMESTPAPEKESPAQADGKADAKSKRLGCGLVLGIIIILAIVFAVFSGGKSDNDDGYDDVEAYTYAKLYITENYYSDAEFEMSDSTVDLDEDGNASVYGKFSHGGVVYRYSVTLTLIPEGARITSCDIY